MKNKCDCWNGKKDNKYKEYFFVRSEPDLTPVDKEKDSVDMVYECAKCHTLYRLYLKPIKFVKLEEGDKNG